MLGGLLLGCLHWMTFTVMTLAATCDTGWFGTGCKFRCQCNNTLTCDIDGACINNSACAVPYFGHACQYANLLFWDSAVPASQGYLRDNNDATCNPDPQATSVSVSLSTKYRLKWFRIHSKDKSRLMNFSIHLDNRDDMCQNERRYNVSDTIVEVMCDINVNVSKVEIVGDVAPNVCSLYVSIGRNVARRQYTNQTSTFAPDGDIALSSNAVDGYVDHNYYSGTCTRTADAQLYSEWFLFLQREYVLYLIRIFNRQDFSQRLVGFKLFTKDINNSNLTTYTDTSVISHQVYNIVVTDQRPVSSLSVWQADVPGESNNEHILTLCEVETYGDSICGEHTFGLDCANTCNCTQSQVCSPVSGACSEFCNIGLYGNNCTQSCAAVCSDTVGCATNTGECISCKRPFKAPNCTLECLDGLYGSDCDMSCPPDCLDSKCEKTTGHCLGCNETSSGNQCENCADGLYGLRCSISCPRDCICLRSTGKCLICKDNRVGDMCEDYESSNLFTETWIIAAVVILACLMALFMCLMRQRQRRVSEPEQRPET